VLMAIILACWRWLTSPADGMEPPAARVPRVLGAAKHAALAQRLPLAPLHVPMPRGPSLRS